MVTDLKPYGIDAKLFDAQMCFEGGQELAQFGGSVVVVQYQTPGFFFNRACLDTCSQGLGNQP